MQIKDNEFYCEFDPADGQRQRDLASNDKCDQHGCQSRYNTPGQCFENASEMGLALLLVIFHIDPRQISALITIFKGCVYWSVDAVERSSPFIPFQDPPR